MKVSVIGGTGYVGLVTGVGLAACGNDVVCADINEDAIDGLNKGILPMYEEGLAELLENARSNNRITFTTSVKDAVSQSDIVVVAVGTPENNSGSTDMRQIYKALKSIAEYMDRYKTIVIKSTVPVGTCEMAEVFIRENLKDFSIAFDVVSNPEFLREGNAVNDFLNPDRIVIGARSQRAFQVMKELYGSFDCPMVLTDHRSSEMIKYASNSYLAARISFINEVAEICECVNADIRMVAQGMKYDKRIGGSYLDPGPGFGGPCLSKDIKSLINTGIKHGANVNLLKSVVSRNEIQIKKVVDYIHSLHKTISCKRIAILGLSFKAGTDDTRNSPAIQLIKNLVKYNCLIKVYDPAVKSIKKIPAARLVFCGSAVEAAEEACCLVIMTEWEEFKEVDWAEIYEKMQVPFIIDMRSVVPVEEVRKLGFNVKGTGLATRHREIQDGTLENIV